jgi:hypothetical protein
MNPKFSSDSNTGILTEELSKSRSEILVSNTMLRYVFFQQLALMLWMCSKTLSIKIQIQSISDKK